MFSKRGVSTIPGKAVFSDRILEDMIVDRKKVYPEKVEETDLRAAFIYGHSGQVIEEVEPPSKINISFTYGQSEFPSHNRKIKRKRHSAAPKSHPIHS